MTQPPSNRSGQPGRPSGGRPAQPNRPVGPSGPGRPSGGGGTPGPGRGSGGTPGGPSNRPVGATTGRPAQRPVAGGQRDRVRGNVGMRQPQRNDDDRRRLMIIAGIVVVALVVVVGGFLVLRGNGSTAAPIGASSPGASSAAGSGSAAPSGSTKPAAAANFTAPKDCPTAAPKAWGASDTATVTLNTDKGAIVIAVKGSLAPHAAADFVALAQCHFYDGVVFHRLVPGFVIQGGDGQYGREPNVDASKVGGGGPGYTIQDDPVTTAYGRGVVAMARTQAPNSQGSQFFIVTDNGAIPALKQANTYAIIGSVTSGMDAVDAIAAMPNAGEAAGNAALDPLPITSVTVTQP